MVIDDPIIKCNHIPIFIPKSHEYVCEKCGLVLEKHFTQSKYCINDSNKNYYNSGKRYVSLGKQINTSGLGSYIDYSNRSLFSDAFGKVLNPNKQKMFRRLKFHYSQQYQDSENSIRYEILNILNRVSSILEISDNVRNRAGYIYTKILKKLNKKDYTNHIILISLSLFKAIKESGRNAPITIQELASIFDQLGHRVSPRTIIREYSHLRPIVFDLLNFEIRKSEDFINRHISNLIQNREIRERIIENNIKIEHYETFLEQGAKKLLKRIDVQHRGLRPSVFGIALLYRCDQILTECLHLKRSILTKNLLCQACKCSLSTLRGHYRVIKQYLNPLDFSIIEFLKGVW